MRLVASILTFGFLIAVGAASAQAACSGHLVTASSGDQVASSDDSAKLLKKQQQGG